MTLLGLPLAWLLAVFAAASALIVLVHRDRGRPTPAVVPALEPWRQLLREAGQTATQRKRIRVSAALLCLLIAACLTLSLGEPAIAGIRSEPPPCLVVMDAGFSMATQQGRRTRLQLAKDQARHLIRDLAPNQQMAIAAVGPVAQPLVPFTLERDVLQSAVDGLNIMAGPSNPQAMWDFVRDSLHAKQANVVIITDGALAVSNPWNNFLPDTEVSTFTVGSRVPNLAIHAFGARRDLDDRESAALWLSVGNSGPHATTATLEVLDGRRRVHSQSMHLQARARASISIPHVLAITGALTTKIIPASPAVDGLTLDSVAYAAVPPHKALHVRLVTSGNRFLEAALRSDPMVEVQVKTPKEHAESSPDPRGIDAIVFDDVLPNAAPTLPALYIHPSSPTSSAGHTPLQAHGTLTRPFFERMRADEPLLRATALHDINIAEALHLEVEPKDTIAAAAASGPLLVRGTRHDVPFVALAFRLVDSDLPLRAAFPVLIQNCLSWLTGFDHAYLDSRATFTRVHVPAPTATSQATQVLGPQGSVPSERISNELRFTPEVPGIYRVSGQSAVIAVNVQHLGGPRSSQPGSESSKRTEQAKASEQVPLAASQTADASQSDKSHTSWLRRLGHPAWQLLLLATLFLMAGEWLFHHRRLGS